MSLEEQYLASLTELRDTLKAWNEQAEKLINAWEDEHK
jgi:hypothetical protein